LTVFTAGEKLGERVEKFGDKVEKMGENMQKKKSDF
jgi:DNA anti-recombination protein RmuC